jgi:hypothetical protein
LVGLWAYPSSGGPAVPIRACIAWSARLFLVSVARSVGEKI